MEDFHLREKITHFDHERIPERVVHARGAAAHGVFVSYGTDLTRARFLAEEGHETEVFVRSPPCWAPAARPTPCATPAVSR